MFEIKNHTIICTYHKWNTECLGVTIGLDDENVIVSEIKGNVQICIDLKIGALERNVPVYLQTIPITGNSLTYFANCLVSTKLLFIVLSAATSNADYVDIQNNATLTAGLSALQDDKLCTNIVIINDNALENNEDFNIFLSTALLERGLVIVQSAHATERITIMEDMMDCKFDDGVMMTYKHLFQFVHSC